MSGVGLKVNIWMHGRNERRSEIKLIIRMPPGVAQSTPEMHTWTEQFMLHIADDLKHTRSWGCEQCGKPSREIFWHVIHWSPVPEPTMTVWGFALCCANSPCMAEMRRRDVRAMVKQLPPPHFMSPPPAPLVLNVGLYNNPDTFVPALSSSCAGCYDDITAAADFDMSKCSGCQLTRYCSSSCQREDWYRHKRFCQAVQEVKKVKGLPCGK
ncbi:hypothetical protein DFH06DRAFT_1237283 [Mycena polygramma]|nr:hypothetical protein DFH06DRAFT_1237283 [Mycena polygramma]